MASNSSNPIPLTNVSKFQIDDILRKLQLVAPYTYDVDGRIELLRSSVVFNNGLGDYENDDILVLFKKGSFVDFQTTDGSFDGLFPKASKSGKTLYPCQVCAGEVTDEKNTTGFGIQCDGGSMFFHNSCTKKPLTPKQFEAITNSPSYVKVLCPPCNRVYGSADLKLKRIEKKVTSTEFKVETIKNHLSDTTSKPSYSSIAGKKSSSERDQQTPLPRNLVKSLDNMTKASRESQNADQLKRTRLVIHPENTNIRTSRDIRREFNKNHNGVIIKHCRLTASGSITIEFEDEESAKTVHSNWSTNYFGGNKGMKLPGESNTVGIIKHVYDELSEQEMRDDLMNHYPEEIEECEFFKRKSDNSFMGLIKIVCKSRVSLLKIIDEKVKLCNQRYLVEEYKRKARVIKCNKCQGWGHVHRYCGKSAKCGKCAGNHETITCNITSGFKCAHCDKNHKAGSIVCEVYKEKLAKFSVNSNYE